jgi:hypothetical protein
VQEIGIHNSPQTVNISASTKLVNEFTKGVMVKLKPPTASNYVLVAGSLRGSCFKFSGADAAQTEDSEAC